MRLQQVARFENTLAPRQRACLFFDMLREELESCETFLATEEVQILRTYCSKLRDVPQRRVENMRAWYARRVMNLVGSIHRGTKVMDAGCGLGSECILAAMLGGVVQGIDLRLERLAVARKRAEFYQRGMGIPLQVQFMGASILDISDRFDVIHAQEAITHIEPWYRFVLWAHEALSGGGKLIISDHNALNPWGVIKSKIVQRRLGGVYVARINPNTGEKVAYAQERLVNIISLMRRLQGAGFTIEKLDMYGFSPYVPNALVSKLGVLFEGVVSRIPLLRLLGASYTLVAVRI